MSFHDRDCGEVGGGWPHPASAHNPFVVLPPLTAVEAAVVRNVLWHALHPEEPLQADQGVLWSLHTAFAESVANHR